MPITDRNANSAQMPTNQVVNLADLRRSFMAAFRWDAPREDDGTPHML